MCQHSIRIMIYILYVQQANSRASHLYIREGVSCILVGHWLFLESFLKYRSFFIPFPPCLEPWWLPLDLRTDPVLYDITSVLLLVTHIFNHISLTNEVSTNDFLWISLHKMEPVVEVYLMLVVDALHTMVTNVSQEERKLLISRRVWSSSSICMHCVDS